MPFDVRKPNKNPVVVIRSASAHELSNYEKFKLQNIEENAQENKIEMIKLDINGKKVHTSISNKEAVIELGELALHNEVVPSVLSKDELFIIDCALDLDKEVY
jgi:hypothetical protein